MDGIVKFNKHFCGGSSGVCVCACTRTYMQVWVCVCVCACVYINMYVSEKYSRKLLNTVINEMTYIFSEYTPI